jgi:hypothetical protein
VFRFKKELYLKVPCPGSRYAYLFEIPSTKKEIPKKRYTAFLEDDLHEVHLQDDEDTILDAPF